MNDPQIQFFDTHAHLPMLKHDTVDNVLERSTTAGVTEMVTVATEVANWQASAECAAKYPNVHYTLGIHPHSAKEWVTHGAQLTELLAKRDSKCVAVGEIGLDFYYSFSSREEQLECLRGQLTLAKQHELPIIVHCREAFADFFSLLREVGLSHAGGVMHCFTGSTPDATEAIDLGMKISFSGILTFKNAEALRETAKRLPLESIVLETDCPYLAPLSRRGRPNEPSFLPETAQVLADLHGSALSEIARQTTGNARALFGIA